MIDVAAKVLFFGQDTRRCIPMLQSAGYSVDAFGSPGEMHIHVEDPDAAAVAVSGAWEPLLYDPVLIARERRRIPFVFFAGSGRQPDPSIFDLVVPAERSPAGWLGELDLLIRACRATRDEARRVTAASNLLEEQARAVIEQSKLVRERSRLERESSQSVREQSRLEQERSRRQRYESSGAPPGKWDLEDVSGIGDFAKTAPPASAVPCQERDRLHWAIMIGLAKLNAILSRTVRARLDKWPWDQIRPLFEEERRLAADLEALLKECKAHRALHGC
ncbi:hypothetical protein [Occallatibacter riparius]|uniref:Uncharacterized protein n=1 Tax=Occallatibacter riparius TaxID=1002689 RepID=A0A9J7BY80_9BACT|nr:hypothetical protein [Occallatibacter riparius]UWZ86333.1 hypothetical protein MOP44_10390 [Occallatibacter riparius]